MRLQDRNPELRSPLRDVIRNDFSTKPTYFGMAFFADSVFLSIIQQQVPGIFWQRPEAIQQVECLPKLAKLITSNSYKFNLAISLLTPPNITNAENGYVPEDYRKLICENSIFNANFADDLIDLFFNYEFWGDKFDRRYLFNFILPEYVEEALDLQARTLPQAELKAKAIIEDAEKAANQRREEADKYSLNTLEELQQKIDHLRGQVVRGIEVLHAMDQSKTQKPSK